MRVFLVLWLIFGSSIFYLVTLSGSFGMNNVIGSFFEKLFLLLQANLQKSLRSDVFRIKSAIALATKNGQASYQHIVLFTDKISYLTFYSFLFEYLLYRFFGK